MFSLLLPMASSVLVFSSILAALSSSWAAASGLFTCLQVSTSLDRHVFKGTVSQDFALQVFRQAPENNIRIISSQSAPPVSTTGDK